MQVLDFKDWGLRALCNPGMMRTLRASVAVLSLASLAILGTLALSWLAYPHRCIVARPQVVPGLRWMATSLLLRVASFDSLLPHAVEPADLLCALLPGALRLALKQ